jgi:hypothetical protein
MEVVQRETRQRPLQPPLPFLFVLLRNLLFHEDGRRK